MNKNYSTAIAEYWKNYLTLRRRDYDFDEETGTISCQLYCEALKDDTDFIIEIDEKNFCICAKLPFTFDNEDFMTVSDFIFSVNRNPVFAHFIMDCKKREVYCVCDMFYDDKTPDKELVFLAFDYLNDFIKNHFERLITTTYKNVLRRAKNEK